MENKTAEEVLNEWNRYGVQLSQRQYECAIDAMKEYAQQQSIAFALYIAENKWISVKENGDTLVRYTPDFESIKLDQLYTQYLNDKNK